MPDTPKLPLREPTFFILLSLAHTRKHGYAILKDIQTLSQGKINLSNGTLYGALTRLQQRGLIERIATPAAEQNGRDRKEYQLTPDGLTLLNAETRRMQDLVEMANLRLQEAEA